MMPKGNLPSRIRQRAPNCKGGGGGGAPPGHTKTENDWGARLPEKTKKTPTHQA